MIVTRKFSLAAVATLVLVAGAALTTGSAAEARAPKPVITSVEAAYGSSVGYAHLVIHGRHLTGGKVTVAGRHVYAKVVSSTVISAFPAGHHHGKRYRVFVRTKAGKSNAKRYEYRYAGRSRLHATAVPGVPGGTVAELRYSATRCPAAGTCVSVGSDNRGPVARVTTGGRTVTQRVPLPAGARRNDPADLTALSCPTVRFCAAVGGYDDSNDGLFSSWDGHTWTSRRAPTPAGSNNPLHDLTAVSCGGAGHCVALDGDYVYTFDNGAPGVVAAVAPRGYRGVQFARVSCPAAGWCAVIGSGDAGKADRNFVAVRRGTTWTTRVLSNPRGWQSKTLVPDLDGFDCAYADRCTVLAGGLAGGLGSGLYFGVLHAGTARWTPVRLPADAKRHSRWASAESEDASLHCPSSNTCWALSAYSVRGLSGQRGYQPVALRLHDGAKAQVFPLPRPASSKTGFFAMNDISCPTTNSCVAVGDRGDGDVNNVRGDAIVETYAKGVWTPVAAPSPAGRPKYSGYEFTSVDCGAVARCNAVGDYNYAHNPDAEDGEPLQQARPVVLTVAPR